MIDCILSDGNHDFCSFCFCLRTCFCSNPRACAAPVMFMLYTLFTYQFSASTSYEQPESKSIVSTPKPMVSMRWSKIGRISRVSQSDQVSIHCVFQVQQLATDCNKECLLLVLPSTILTDMHTHRSERRARFLAPSSLYQPVFAPIPVNSNLSTGIIRQHDVSSQGKWRVWTPGAHSYSTHIGPELWQTSWLTTNSSNNSAVCSNQG